MSLERNQDDQEWFVVLDIPVGNLVQELSTLAKIMTFKSITKNLDTQAHPCISIFVGFQKHSALPRSLTLTIPNTLTLNPKPSSNLNPKSKS